MNQEVNKITLKGGIFSKSPWSFYQCWVSHGCDSNRGMVTTFRKVCRGCSNPASLQLKLNVLRCLSFFLVSRNITPDKVHETWSSVCAVNKISGAMTIYTSWEPCSRPLRASPEGTWCFLLLPYASSCRSSLQSYRLVPDSSVKNNNGDSKP